MVPLDAVMEKLRGTLGKVASFDDGRRYRVTLHYKPTFYARPERCEFTRTEIIEAAGREDVLWIELTSPASNTK